MENNTQFTKEEVKEIYGQVEMKFVYYFEGKFTFEGEYGQGRIIGETNNPIIEISSKPTLLEDLISSLSELRFHDNRNILKNTIPLN